MRDELLILLSGTNIYLVINWGQTHAYTTEHARSTFQTVCEVQI